MVEVFKAIEGFEDLYEVSNLGRVRSLDRWVNHNSKGDKKYRKGRVLKPAPNKKGYLMVVLCKDGKMKTYLVHRLVAEAFIPNPQSLPQVNHKDEDKTNNFVCMSNIEESNLEWCTYEYNINYGTHTERMIEKLSQKVQAFNKDGVLVFEFPSTAEAGRNGFNCGNISSCCRGKQKTHKGLVWKYA